MSIDVDIIEKIVIKCLSSFDDKIEWIITAIKRLEQKTDFVQGATERVDNGYSARVQGTTDHPVSTSTKPQKAAEICTTIVKSVSAPSNPTDSKRSQRALARQRRDSSNTAQNKGIKHDSTHDQTSTHPPTAPPVPQHRRQSIPATNITTTRSTIAKPVAQHSKPLVNLHAPRPSIPVPSSQVGIPTEQADTPVGTDWQKVQNKRRPQRKVIVGSGERDSDVQIVERVKKLHACFFHPDTTEEMINTYMTKKGTSQKYNIQKLNLKHTHYASFAITVPASKYDFFMEPGQWPPGTEISTWNFHAGARRASRPSRDHYTARSSAAAPAPATEPPPPVAAAPAPDYSKKKHVNKQCT